jgi:two-component system, OmpR family, sensor kinase
MQEARGTAQTLREGVTHLKSIQGDSPLEKTPPVETMLDALDGAIEMFGDLENTAQAGKDRRGRIDVAALLFVLAPEARISLEPGAGTEVYGVESDLKRMLGVLLGQPGSLGSKATSGISVRRDGDWVRISVEMGPEGILRGDLESRWLSRMSLRQGGRVEFERGRLSLLLPAHRASEKREIEQLRKELEQAQRLGAVYARELAESFGSSNLSSSVPPMSVPQITDRLHVLIGLTSPIRRMLRPLVEDIRAELKQLSNQLGEGHSTLANLSRRANAAGDLVAELDRLAACTATRESDDLDLSVLVPNVLGQLGSLAGKLGVEVGWSADENAHVRANSSVAELLLHALFDQAILATPIGQTVTISVCCEPEQVVIRAEDGGPVIPESALVELQLGLALPQSLGRSAELMWLVAGACAENLGVRLLAGTSITLRSEIRAVIPRSR